MDSLIENPETWAAHELTRLHRLIAEDEAKTHQAIREMGEETWAKRDRPLFELFAKKAWAEHTIRTTDMRAEILTLTARLADYTLASSVREVVQTEPAEPSSN